MGLFFVYILKASLCLAVFYLFYRLLLSKETFHRFNRIALLGLLALSCLLPWMKVTLHEAPEIGQALVSLEEMMAFVPKDEGVWSETPSHFPWKEVMLLVYVAGIFFFLARHLWSLGRMLYLLRTSRRETLEDGIMLFVHQQKIAPFSWMKWIAVSEADLAEGGEAVLTHERAHIANHHSWDLLLAEVCTFFQWFNPAAWLLKQELQTIHEYEADEWVIRSGIDARNYQLLLIKKAVGAKLYYMANSFNQSSLKKRITMMMKKKSNPWARMKYAYVLPLAAVAVAAFARPEVSNRLDEISSVDVGLLVQTMQDKAVKVTGQVLDAETKQPVQGASVIIRGTTNGTLSDKDGNFALSGVSVGDVIQISFVGFQTQSVVVKDETPLSILMKNDIQSMQELTVVGYAQDGVGAPTGDPDNKVVSVVNIPAPQEEFIFQVVEEMPQFPGGEQEAMKFLADHVKYPLSAQKAKVEGRVIVQFVVGKDGSILNPKVVRSVNPELDAEALRVVGIMPKWNPGKQRGKAVAVTYTLPISFYLLQKAENATAGVALKVEKGASAVSVKAVEDFFKVDDSTSVVVLRFPQGINQKVGVGPNGGVGYENINSMTIQTEKGKEPLIVVDGKELGRGAHLLKELSPNEINKIEVLKDADAKAQYGDKAKQGVVLVTTKKK